MSSALLLLRTPGFCFQRFRSGSWGFFGFFVSCIKNLPQLRMHAVIFSPLWFLCILLLEETFVQVQALQQRVPGPSLCQLVVTEVS